VKTQRQKDKEALENAVHIQSPVDDLICQVKEQSLTEAQARLDIVEWSKSNGYDGYSASKLFEEGLSIVAKDIDVRVYGERLNAIDLIDDPSQRWQAERALRLEFGLTRLDIRELRGVLKVTATTDIDEWAMPVKEFGDIELGASEWLFEGLLPANKTTLLVADSKTGKSLVGYDWVYSLATGEPWGEFRAQKSRKVLIVQTDESEVDCQERLLTRGLNTLENVRVIREFNPYLMGRLTRFVEDWKPEVLLFDSLTSIQRDSGYSPKDPEYAYWLYDLKDFAVKHRCTPIVITHTNKAPLVDGLSKVFGTHLIAAAASEIFILTRPKDPAADVDRVLIRMGSRSNSQSAWLIGLNLEDYSWEYKFPCTQDGAPLEGVDRATAEERLTCKEGVLSLLAKSPGGLTSDQLAERLSISTQSARRVCKELTDAKMVKRSKMGKAFIYRHSLVTIAD
jgi:predicted transcriptional regulator